MASTSKIFNNDTVSLNNMWYESHKNLLASVLIHLGQEDKMSELCDKFLGDKPKMKTYKDKNKPKRGLSAYLFWCNEVREDINSKLKKDKGGKNVKIPLGETSKALSNLWKTVSKEDRVKYEDMAKKDKERYLEEMASYN